MTPGVSPDEGAVTVNVLAADAPGATVPRETGPDGETCQPDGTPWDTDAPVSGCPVGLRSVAVTLKVPAASALAEMSASVGSGLGGGPYTSAEEPGLATGCTAVPPAWWPAATRLTWSRPPVPSRPQTAMASV